MPLNTITVSMTKDNILSTIKNRGPILPVQIAREVKLEPLFAAAFLSELYREQKLLMSHLKVGSSSLYLLPGQESQLENFIEHLNQREREAFHLIKKDKISDEELLSPVMRVAIRNIQDFAEPMKITLNGNQKTFWKYSQISDQEALDLINTSVEPKKIEKEIELEKAIEETKQPAKEKAPEKKEIIDEIKVERPKKEKKPKSQESDFTKKLKDYLLAKDIEILQIIEEKKKEFYARIRTNETFGKQEYYLIAKDRKRIKEEDLTLTLHKAQQEKLLALFMAPGDLDAKAQLMIKDYKNIVKFEKLKF